MKRIAVIAVALLFFLIPVSSVNGGNEDHLRIYEVFPYGKCEGFSLKNYGTTAVDLSDYVITDGEGDVTFLSFTLYAGESITILKDTPDDWIAYGRVILDLEYITFGRFQLNDDGDEIVLMRNGNIVDVFVYGKGHHPSWIGDPFPKFPKNRFAKRASVIDTDSSKDWSLSIPGSDFRNDMFEGIVTPFTFPESMGHPVMSALNEASEEVLISIYILDHRDIISILLALLDRDVNVTILLEGSPSGGVPEKELGYMAALHRSGADIMMMKNTDGFKRFSYNHGKYAVIDSEKVIVTSENWRESSFNGNRGWGVIAESCEYAEYMRNVFEADSDDGYGDVHDFRDLYPGVLPLIPPVYDVPPVDRESFYADIIPIVGPDHSYDTIAGIMGSASYRLYSQQLDVDISWIAGDTLLTLMANSYSIGVDTRLMIDVTFDSPYDNDMNDGYWVKELMTSVNIRTTDDCDMTNMVHNKGIIADDTVVIGSMNWNDSSFTNNREISVAITSYDAASIYASAFLEDWGYDGDVILNVDVRHVNGNVVLDASSSHMPEGSVVGWDLDGDGIADRHGIKVVTVLNDGWNECMLIVTCPDGSEHSKSFSVHVQHENGIPSYLKYIPIVAICAIIIAIRIVRRRDDT